jgi:hypothetical protein
VEETSRQPSIQVVAWLLEHLTSKHEALSSDSSTSRKKRERKASTLLVARGQGKKRRVVTASMGVVFPMEIMKMSQIQRTGCCTELLA